MFKQFILYTHTNFNQSNVSNVIRTVPRIHCIVQFGWFFGRTKIFVGGRKLTRNHTQQWNGSLVCNRRQFDWFISPSRLLLFNIWRNHLRQRYTRNVHWITVWSRWAQRYVCTGLNAIVVATKTAEMCSLHTTHATGVDIALQPEHQLGHLTTEWVKVEQIKIAVQWLRWRTRNSSIDWMSQCWHSKSQKWFTSILRGSAAQFSIKMHI